MTRKIFWSAVIGALAVSFIYGLPYLLIKKELATQNISYHPISVFADWDEALVYVPLTATASRMWRQTDPALLEHQSTPLMLPPANPIIFGALTRIIGIESLWIGVDFILPPLIFLLFLAIMYRISANIWLSFLLSVIFIFTRNLAALIPFSTLEQLRQFLIFFKPFLSRPVNSFLPFDRMFSPEWTFIPLAVFFLLLVTALIKNKKIFYITAGLAYGFFFYTYFYDWVITTIALAVMLIIAVLRRDKELAKKILLTGIIGLAVSVFYWLNFWRVLQLPQYPDISLRASLEVGRVFRWSHWPHYLFWALWAGWILFKRYRDPLLYLAAAIFIASIVSLNTQLVVGYVPQPYHFLEFSLAIPLFIAYYICGLKLWEEYRERFKKYGKCLVAMAGIGALLVSTRAVQSQISYAQNNEWRYINAKTIDESFNWLRTNLSATDVVLSPSFITNSYLMTATPVKVFYPPTGLVTSAPNREIVERYLIAAKLFGATDSRLQELFNPNYISAILAQSTGEPENEQATLENLVAKALLHGGFNVQNPSLIYNNATAYRQLEVVEKTLDNFTKSWNSDKASWLKKYSWQYVYFGPYEKKFCSFTAKNFPGCLKTVYQNEAVTIYTICSDTVNES